MAQAPARRRGEDASVQSVAPPRRGRPKGTGIDDATTLAEIGRLLKADPELKPTTAIKRVGVTDPSVVRRLREKLKLPDTPTSDTPIEATPISSTPRPVAASPTPMPNSSSPKPRSPRTSATRGRTQKPSPQAIALAAALADAVAVRRDTQAPEQPAPTTPGPEPVAGNTASKSEPEIPAEKPKSSRAENPRSKPTTSTETPHPSHNARESSDASSTTPPPIGPTPIGPTPIGVSEASADILRASVEAATSMTRLHMEMFEHLIRLSPLNKILQQQKTITDALTSALAAQRMRDKKKDGDA
jgi:hypothetical protein